MKAIKKLFKCITWIFALLVLAVLLLPLWIGPVATTVSEKAVPKITGTPFHLGEFALNQYTGRLRIGDMRLENPARFYTASETSAKNPLDVKSDGMLSAVANQVKNAAAAAGDAVAKVGDALATSETNAVKLAALEVNLSPLSVLTDTIHIQEIKIDGLYIFGDMTFANLREIAKNASGDDDGAKKEEKKDAKKEESAKDDGDGKKVVIDRVLLTGAKIQWGHVAVPLPEIELKDIGKDGKAAEGVDAESAFGKVLEGVCEAADKVCKGAGSALKLAIEGADAVAAGVGAVAGAAGDAVKGIAGAAGEIGKGAADAVKSVAGAAGDIGKGAADAAGNIGKGAADAAKGAANAAGDIGKGAVDAAKGAAGAVGNAAKGAVEGVKNFFK